jgi:serine/threonine protein kinase
VWKLADFGIVRVPGSTLTIEGQFLGSPWYAAPESLRSGSFSPASDVYGLGATLYEAATGKPPHGVDDVGALLKRLDDDPPPPKGMPEPIAVAILAALARDPAQRPTAEQLAHMLAPAEAPAASKWWTRRRIAIALGAAAIALIVLAVASHRSSGPDCRRGRSPAGPGPTWPCRARPCSRRRDRAPGRAPGGPPRPRSTRPDRPS